MSTEISMAPRGLSGKSNRRIEELLEAAESAAEGKFRGPAALEFAKATFVLEGGHHFKAGKYPEAVKIWGAIRVEGRSKPLATAIRVEATEPDFPRWAEVLSAGKKGDEIVVGAGRLTTRMDDYGRLPLVLD